MAVVIPFGKTGMALHQDLSAGEVLESRVGQLTAAASEDELVRAAMAAPIGSPPLCELAAGKRTCTVIISDHTRPVPSRHIVPFMLEELRRGSPDIQITLLVATGFHRPTSAAELEEKLGRDIVARERIVIHDSRDAASNVNIGVLPSGADCVIDRLAVETDLLIAEGFIEPHFFAGFSGGRKSILPGICSEVTVNENHSYKAIASPYSVAGVLEKNPIHEDMVAAARAVNVQFTFNVALDGEKKIIAAFCGDLVQSHEKGVEFIRGLSQCPSITGDIVVTSNGGYPLDQNLYQSPKAVATAEACAGEDGVIIMCCSCADGMGGTHFEKLITMGTVDEIDSYLSKIPPKETIPEQWCPQIYARILKKHPVILVTTYLPPEQVKQANMIPAATPDEALKIAYDMKGKDASVVVIPDGVSVLAVKESKEADEHGS